MRQKILSSARKPPREDQAKLSRAVRSLRERFGETTTEFGSRLGVHNSAVSNYERGKRGPSTSVLLRLYAEAGRIGCVTEKEIFANELQRHMDAGLIGGPPGWTAEAIADSMIPVLGKQKIGDALMDLLGDKARDMGFRKFVVGLSHVIDDCETVDESVTEILHLWATHSGNPKAPEYFRDILGVLRTMLWADRKAAAGDAKSPSKGK